MTISKEENEVLTQVGPGTSGGDLLRRYWHPVAATKEMEGKYTLRTRLLGEDLILYRDLSGQYGLIEPHCAHRRMDLFYGIPEEDGLRCPYHGWKYDETGQCIEQPFEQTVDPNSHFMEKICLSAYPVEELGGLLWTYMGPLPAPLIPHWEPFIREGAYRDIGITELPCNWLQVMENSLDPVHVEWLHGHFTSFASRQFGAEINNGLRRKHIRIGFDVYDHGIIKRRIYEGETEEDPDWATGHPVVFPNLLFFGPNDSINVQIRVPVDDENTRHYFYAVYSPQGRPAPEDFIPPVYEVPVPREDDNRPEWRSLRFVPGQDLSAWVSQGPIAKRELEHIGHTDTGVILFRKLLSDNIKRVEDGADPMNTFWDPATNVSLSVQQEVAHGGRHSNPGSQYSPFTAEIARIFAEAKEKATSNA